MCKRIKYSSPLYREDTERKIKNKDKKVEFWKQAVVSLSYKHYITYAFCFIYIKTEDIIHSLCYSRLHLLSLCLSIFWARETVKFKKCMDTFSLVKTLVLDIIAKEKKNPEWKKNLWYRVKRRALMRIF